MSPTRNSCGRKSSRDPKSAHVSSHRSRKETCRQHDAVVGAYDQANHVGHNQTDKADDAAHRNRQPP